jgi:hypothetical protein
MTTAGPIHCEGAILSQVIFPIGPAKGIPLSSGGMKCAGQSSWVPVCSSIR